MTRRGRHASSPLVTRLVPPGTVVPLDEVATVLGMTVIPVRESLKILIGEGLVEQHARGAYTVAQLARSELLELYAARGVLENAVLTVAVAAAGRADHAHAPNGGGVHRLRPSDCKRERGRPESTLGAASC